MWISELDAAGIAECVEGRSLERNDVAPRPWMDALLLFAVGAGAPLATADPLGWGLEPNEPAPDGTETTEPSPGAEAPSTEVVLSRPGNARRILTDPHAHVTVTLQPDPPLFGRLRNAVLREPEQAAGLEKGTLSARIGWLFTPDFVFATRDRLGASLGDVALPASCSWIDPLLRELVQRIVLVAPGPLPLEALLAAQLSTDAEQRERATRALSQLQGRFGLDLRLVRTDRIEAAIGPDLRPLRWSDPQATGHVRLVLATELLQPDVLLLPHPPDPLERAYLDDRLEGDEAVLEQVLVAG